jgi:hypothetical protein
VANLTFCHQIVIARSRGMANEFEGVRLRTGRQDALISF